MNRRNFLISASSLLASTPVGSAISAEPLKELRIGYMAMQAREFMQTDVIVLSILLYALLGKGADMLVKALERWRLGWHPAFQAPR